MVETLNLSKKTVAITIASEHDLPTVSAFVKKHYMKEYGTVPSDPHTYLVAKNENGIVGTAGIDYHNDQGKLPIELLYDFDYSHHAELPILNIENCVQFGKWSAEEGSGVSMPIVFAVSLYAQKQKKQFAWIEQKKSANILLRRSKITFKEIPYSSFAIHLISETDKAFYIENSPRPYLMELAQVIDILSLSMADWGHIDFQI